MPWIAVTKNDIEARFRPLSDAETATIDALIADAQDILETAAANIGITSMVGFNTDTATRNYIRIVANMVIRVLRNPDGYLTETTDDYTYRRDSAISAGSLYVGPEEVEQLRPADAPRRRGSFNIVLGKS